MSLVKQHSKLFFVENLWVALMDSHFHIVLRMLAKESFTDKDIMKRLHLYYGEGFEVPEGQIPYYRERLSHLANFMNGINQSFSVYFNRKI